MVKSLIIVWSRVIVLILAGLFIGAVLGLWAINKYMVVEAAIVDSRLSYVPHGASLEVVHNYGEQKTANVHVLEPKVSDVYYQYAPDVIQYIK